MRSYTSVLKLVFAGALLAAPMFAQSAIDVQVNVPFAFHVGAQDLPAGRYTLKANGGSSLLTIQDRTGRNSAIAVTSRDGAEPAPVEAQLVFRVYGSAYYLAGVQVPNAFGRALPMSSAERREAGTQTASIAVAPAAAHR